jgi:hypothetical protein
MKRRVNYDKRMELRANKVDKQRLARLCEELQTNGSELIRDWIEKAYYMHFQEASKVIDLVDAINNNDGQNK